MKRFLLALILVLVPFVASAQTTFYTQENNTAASVYGATLWNGAQLAGQNGAGNGRLVFAYYYGGGFAPLSGGGFTSAQSATNGAASRSGLQADGNGRLDGSGFDFLQGGGGSIGVSLSPRTNNPNLNGTETLVAQVGFSGLNPYATFDTIKLQFNINHPFNVNPAGTIAQTGVSYYYPTIAFRNSSGQTVWLIALAFQSKCDNSTGAVFLGCSEVFFTQGDGFFQTVFNSSASFITPCAGSNSFSQTTTGPSTFCFTMTASQFSTAIGRINSANGTSFSTTASDYSVVLIGLDFEATSNGGGNPQIGLNFSGLQFSGLNTGGGGGSSGGGGGSSGGGCTTTPQTCTTTPPTCHFVLVGGRFQRVCSGGGTTCTGGGTTCPSGGGGGGTTPPPPTNDPITLVYEWTDSNCGSCAPKPSYISIRNANPPSPWTMVGGNYWTFNNQSSSRHQLYVCQRGTTWDFFTSLSSNCDNAGTLFTNNGYAENNQTSRTPSQAYRCYNTVVGSHLDTTIPNQLCTSPWRIEGPLGWVSQGQ